MTKKELEEKYKTLRSKFDEAEAKLKELEAEQAVLGELTEKGVGGFFDKKTRQWHLVELDFNPETNEAKVSNDRIVGSDLAMFSYELNKFVAEEIKLRSMR